MIKSDIKLTLDTEPNTGVSMVNEYLRSVTRFPWAEASLML